LENSPGFGGYDGFFLVRGAKIVVGRPDLRADDKVSAFDTNLKGD
jgi:hypothetical protein